MKTPMINHVDHLNFLRMNVLLNTIISYFAINLIKTLSVHFMDLSIFDMFDAAHCFWGIPNSSFNLHRISQGKSSKSGFGSLITCRSVSTSIPKTGERAKTHFCVFVKGKYLLVKSHKK